MLLSQYYALQSQRLNATSYPANSEFHLIQPSIHPTEFGGIGEYFAIYRGEIESATYSADAMGYQTQFILDSLGQPKTGLDIYKDSPAGIALVGSIDLGTYVDIIGVPSGHGGNFSFCGKWLCVLGAYESGQSPPKILIINCETMAVNYYTYPAGTSHGNVGNMSVYIGGKPYAVFGRLASQTQYSGYDFVDLETGVFHAGMAMTSSVSVFYGEFMISRFAGGALTASKLKTNTFWDGRNNIPIVEADTVVANITTNASNIYGGQLQAPLDGGYTFSDSASSKLFVLDPVAVTLTYTDTVYNSQWDSHWGHPYYTGPNHPVLPNHTIQNGGDIYYGSKSGFGLFHVYAPAPVGNAQGGYDDGQPYFGKYVATELMRTSTPAVTANLTTIPVKYHGLVSLHRGLVKSDVNGKIIQFGVTDWQTPTSWASAAAVQNYAWYFDAATPVGMTRNDTLFTLNYHAAQNAWVLKNRHAVGIHAAHASGIKTGTKLRLYSLVETDLDLNPAYFGIYDHRNYGTWRQPYDARASGQYEPQHASSVVFSGQRTASGRLNPQAILNALAQDALYYLESAYGGLVPDSVTLQTFLDNLNASTIVEDETTFFNDWANRASKSYVDLTFESRQSTDFAGSVYVLMEVYRGGVLAATATFNSGVRCQYYNNDGSWNNDLPALIIIGSACSSQPLIIEALNAPLPFALRV